MPEKILMMTGIAGAENCAAVLSKQFQMTVETAANWNEGLAALRRREYALVVIDESLIQAEDGIDALLRHAGFAIPVEINFAISGTGRLVREVRATLSRRARERELATRAVTSALQIELREIAAGLLLQSQLALAEPGTPPQLAAKLRAIVALTGSLGERLGVSVPGAQTANPLPEVEPSPIPLSSPFKRPDLKNRMGAKVSESYASSAAGNPSAGTRPDSPGL